MAKRFFSAASFNVFELDLEFWDYPKHAHNFFELICIVKGSGTHKINDSTLEYGTGDIFLLTPSDEHEFIIKSHTVFGYIKFTERVFLEKAELVSDSKWRKKIDAIVLHSNSMPGTIVENEADRKSIFQLYELLKYEYQNPSTYSRSILLELFGALLMIISRNISNDLIIKTFSEKDKTNAVLTYIRQNVLDKEKIKTSKIAGQFYMSPNYVSIYIKKHTGMSIQSYVIHTKMKMSERLLRQTGLTISQIAQKLSFTDSSHFTKTFKKFKNQTPKQFRKQELL